MSIWTTVAAPVLPQPQIPVISVGNLKGGVGKTTVVANLACALVRRGLRVLVIDLDFQASLSVALPPHIVPRCEVGDGGINVLLGSSYDMFHDARVSARGVGPFSDLTLVRTSLDLADVEDRIFAGFVLGKQQEDQRFSLAKKLVDPRLKSDFDIVLIDTPPRLTIASVNALCASTHVLIPTALTPLAYSGAATFAVFLKEFRAKLCPRLEILGILPTFTHAPLNDQEIAFVRQIETNLPGISIWDEQAIPRRQNIADNKSLANSEAREKFLALADRSIKELGVVKHGENASRGLRLGAEVHRRALPQ
jgi:cellulose biosynthesis protein BcsQ